MSATTIGDIASTIITGLSKHGRSPVLSKEEEDALWRAGKEPPEIGLLSSAGILTERVDLATIEAVRVSSLEKVSRYLVEPDDVALICRGTQVRSAVIPSEAALVAISISVIAIRLKPGILLPTLLSSYLNHPLTIQALVRRTQSRTDNLNVSAKHVAQLPIVVPTMEEQRTLCDKCEATSRFREVSSIVADKYYDHARLDVVTALGGA